MREKIKLIKGLTQRLQLRRMERLDFSDRIIIKANLDSIIRQLQYLDHLQHAQCTVVLEACDIHKPIPD